MKSAKWIARLTLSAGALTLGACGGAGGGGPAAVPTPPTTPTPAPTPPPTTTPPMPALPSGAISLTGGPFSTYDAQNLGGTLSVGADDVHISYSATTNLYTLSAPGLQQGRLVDPSASGSLTPDGKAWASISDTLSGITVGDSTDRQSGHVRLDWASKPYAKSDLSYTSFGAWTGNDGTTGLFAYGALTPAAEVPVTGSASYSATIRGQTTENAVVLGGISFNFNFAAGTLSGSIAPGLTDGWDVYPLGTYAFRDTVYSTGSGSFSGAFNVPGSTAGSSFRGSFTGPGAAELMGSWMMPYLSPLSHQWNTMNGVFAGKK